MFESISYHILSHDNSEDILLGINIINKKILKENVFFKRINNDLYFCFDKKNKEGLVFNDIPDNIWLKIYKKNVILVEFGPFQPIESYDVVL